MRRSVLKTPSPYRSLPAAALAVVVSLSTLASACDGGGGAATDEYADTSATSETANDDGGGRTGTFTVGEDTWTVVPSTQCSVFPGNIVMISGHAADNEEVEIVIDHDPSSGLVSAYVQGPDDSPYWIAEDDAITFEIDGKTVKGSGTFKVGLGGTVEAGQPRERQGSFAITC
ncbi:MAG: hypothetical protein U5R46_16475 [Gammaproteobacteria bacterium]|nr:hypothetical protein [Gammaproteobacteria bacterium]